MKKITLYRAFAVPATLIIALLSILIASSFLQKFTNTTQSVHAAGTDLGSLSGNAWSDTLGWISFSGSLYSVAVKADNTLYGYAWANPSDDVGPTNNIGWISFNEADTASCGFGTATLTGTTITGGAKVLSADNNGWNGCIRLDSNSPGVTLNSSGYTQSGTLSGYAWADNTVGGWISFNCTTGGPTGNNICATSNYSVLYTTSTPPPPLVTINSFSGSPSRVRNGNPATLTYNVTSEVACTIANSSDSTTYAVTADSVQHTVTTNAITKNTIFTLACGSVSRSINIGLVPVFQEQ